MKRGISPGGKYLTNDPTRKPMIAWKKGKKKRKAQRAARKRNRK